MKIYFALFYLKLAFVFLFTLLMGNALFAQTNLVYNADFETCAPLPTGSGQINLCTNWYSALGSVDYYYAGCGIVSTPSNFNGYQAPASGAAYAGIVTMERAPWGFTGYTEVLGTQLTQTLVPGKHYNLSMKVSLAENWSNSSGDSSFVNRHPAVSTASMYPGYISSNKIGMKFFTMKPQVVPIPSVLPAYINNTAHLFEPNIISDTTNWTTVQGSFVADSAYHYLLIGNFFTVNNIDTVYKPNGVYSYFFIDDVSVYVDEGAGINESVTDESVSIFPNPSGGSFNVHLNTSRFGRATLLVTNITGAVVRHHLIDEANGNDYSLSGLSAGLYFLVLKAEDNSTIVKKIIVV